jgi:hypothetical protein
MRTTKSEVTTVTNAKNAEVIFMKPPVVRAHPTLAISRRKAGEATRRVAGQTWRKISVRLDPPLGQARNVNNHRLANL